MDGDDIQEKLVRIVGLARELVDGVGDCPLRDDCYKIYSRANRMAGMIGNVDYWTHSHGWSECHNCGYMRKANKLCRTCEDDEKGGE